MDINIVPMKPCPFCGGVELRVFEFDADGILRQPIFFVQCQSLGCRAEGPLGATEKAAIEAWNKRPATVVFISGGTVQEVYPAGEHRTIDYDALESYECPICIVDMGRGKYVCPQCGTNWKGAVTNEDVLKKLGGLEI